MKFLLAAVKALMILLVFSAGISMLWVMLLFDKEPDQKDWFQHIDHIDE